MILMIKKTRQPCSRQHGIQTVGLGVDVDVGVVEDVGVGVDVGAGVGISGCVGMGSMNLGGGTGVDVGVAWASAWMQVQVRV